MPEPAATPTHSAAPGPITSLDDPRAIQILSTEHWSQLSARSLAYNEAFVRGGMFLTFLSMSFVALALLAQGMAFGDDFLTVAAIVLAFDFVVGITTYARISGANVDDLRALHGIARIRHGYVQAAPIVAPYFTAPTHDDIDSVLTSYGDIPSSGIGQIAYALSTSGGMIGMIVSMVGGVLAGVVSLLLLPSDWAVWIGLVGAVVTFLAIVVLTFNRVPKHQARMVALFPAPKAAPPADRAATPDED
ncbi:MAG TPA: hypothetical protein VHR55_09085 [Candidatus Limnocylindria bacterium]|nr:hypothetical protein [Candidatus Limnocylindria bacterium]